MTSRVRVDPIVISVIQHRLLAIVEEMGEAMLRTSYSQILNSSRDFSTAICGLDGRLIAQAEHVPVHVGALPFAAKAVTQFFGDDIHDGDVFLLNDPYHGGNHLPDLTAFVPVFEDGVPRFWSINRAHQSDIGGSTHGAYNAAATEIWQEGLRITPLRIYDRGEPRRDLLEMIATNVRHPRDFRGDLAAMIGSAHVGERRLLALAAEFGWPVAKAAIEAVLDGAEHRTRAVIAQWRDGVYRGEAVLDDDGRGNSDIHIGATVTKRGSDLVIDLSDSHPQVASFINSSYPNTYSSVVVALSYLIDPDTPKNDGAFRPITVVAKPGTVVWANPGAPVTLATNHCGQEIIEAIIKALAPACPERAMAGWGRRFRIAIRGRTLARESRSSGISFRRDRGAGPRLRATAGPAVASGRPRAASNSAASKSPKCAFRCSFGATSSAPTPAGRANIAAVPAGSSKWSSRPRSPPSATLPETACAVAPAAYWAAATGSRTAICYIPGTSRRARSRQKKWVSRFSPMMCWCWNPAAVEAGAISPIAIVRRSRATSITALSPGIPTGRADPVDRIGVDVGGTFTDLVAVDADGRAVLAKTPTTPADPSVGLLEGLKLLAELLGLDLALLLAATERLVHGTTVATNALLERKGAQVGLLTTEGTATLSRCARG
jgi:N-methylhydantoinase B